MSKHRFDDIPSAAQPAPDATPSGVVAQIRALRPSRRTVLKGLLVAAAAATLLPLDWYLTRREAVAATDDGPRTENPTCEKGGYDEERNNWPKDGGAMCVGGFKRGTFPCSDGWHREGTYTDVTSDGTATYHSTRLATNCQGKNAWRWNGVRCSDAMTHVEWDDGDEYNGSTIAVCVLPDDHAGSEGAPVAPVKKAA